MSKLKTALEDKWGVKAAAAAPMMMAAPAAALLQLLLLSLPSSKSLWKSSPDDKKISVIKVVREITDLG